MMATYIGNICVICITCITCIFESLFFCLLYLSNYARGRLLCYNCVPRAPITGRYNRCSLNISHNISHNISKFPS